MTRHRSPGVFGTRKKETAEETLRFWMEHWLDCPFGQELFHCCLQVLGCIPGAEGDGYVSQRRLWLLLQQDCLQGCMMHGNCLAGSAAGSWWGQVLWWKSRLHEMTLSASSTPRPSPTALLLSTLLWELLLLLLACICSGNRPGDKRYPRGSRQIGNDWSQWLRDSES